jgi:hypothetical protein
MRDKVVSSWKSISCVGRPTDCRKNKQNKNHMQTKLDTKLHTSSVHAIGARPCFSVLAIMLVAAFSLLSARATELIVNGGFESGSTGWTLSGGVSASSAYGYARSGSYYAWFGGATNENDAGYQDITIPATATAATLSFYYNINSAESTTTTAYDTFTATIRNTSGTVLATVGNWSNLNGTSQGNPYYYQQTYNLLAYAGQTIRIYFTSHNDPSKVTNFRVDDVSVSVTTASTYTISVSASPSAGGTVGGGGTFTSGSSQTVTATANSSYTFADWTENGSIVSYSASYNFTLNASRTLVANFTQNQVNYTISLSASPSAGGTVGGSGTFASGSSRTVTATPNSGYTFANWTESGSQVSASSSYTFTLSANRNLVANFTSTSGSIVAGLDCEFFPAHADTMADLIQRTNLKWCGYYLDAPSQRLDTGWLGERSYLVSLGWQIAPLYVGQQDPNLGGNLSLNPSAAQGVTDGNEAVAEMGPDTGATQTVYDYDATTGHYDIPKTVTKGQGFASGTVVYLDWENAPISVGNNTAYIVAWCQTVAASNYKPGVYCPSSDIAVIAPLVTAYNVQFWAATWPGQPLNPDGSRGPIVSSTTTQFLTTAPPTGATSLQYGAGYSIQTVNGLLVVDLDTSSLYGGSSAPILPTISAFSVSPASISLGNSFTVSYTVADSGGPGLARVELWLATIDGSSTDSSWAKIATATVSGNGPVSGTLSDTPATTGNRWYGFHAVDTAGNYIDERQAGVGPLQRSVTQVATPAITSPPPNSTLTSSSATFQWSSGTGVSDYFLYVGSTVGNNDIYGQDQGLNQSVTVNSLPQNGSTLYVRLYWQISGQWYAIDYTYTAYTQITYTVAVSASPSAGGSVGGGGTFVSGSSQTVTATANSGYMFANWTENGSVVSSSASYNFTLSANRTLVANFTANPVNYTITVSASPSAGGTVGGGGTFASGSSRTVTATANSGYTFANWTENGSAVSSSASYNFTLNGNRNLVANFTVITPPSFGGSHISGDALQTTLSGLSAGETVVWQVSTDLKNWTPMKTNVVNGSTLSFTNTINPAMPGQYFRAVVQ